MTSATTVEAAATADRASAMEAVTAVKFVASAVSTVESLVAVEPTIPTAMTVEAMSIVTTAVVWMTIEPVEPRASTDEYSVHEVIRSPIAVRRARVRGIWVVAVSANRRRANRDSHRSYSDSDSYSYLCARNGAH